ncbi:MAG: hypothetical protein R6X19_10605 [Kiritimatiellia bacterium]
MSLYSKFVIAGAIAIAGLLHAQEAQINKIGVEEYVDSAYMDRPAVAADSKSQPHFVCDAGGNPTFMKYHKIGGKWRGGPFAIGTKGGRYNAGRLYIGQIEIDSKDRAWISCKFGAKEFGVLGQGVWLYRNITTAPTEQFFRQINVYKGMGVVTTDPKYPDQGVVIGTFGNYQILSQYGQTLKQGSMNAGHGGEKVRARIGSTVPRFGTKGDEKAGDGIWHTAMCGSSAIPASYQSSTRYKAGQGPVTWAAYAPYRVMGDDYHHPGVGVDLTDARYAYMAAVFYGKLCVNIWDGSKMLFDVNNLKVLAYGAAFEGRHAPAITPAPGTGGGAFFFWTASGRIKGCYVSKKGVAGKTYDITDGRSAGAATDRDGNIHLVYYNNGIKYRKLLVSTLEPIAPKGTVADTRTPQFRWTNTKAVKYTLEIKRDGSLLPMATSGAVTWTPDSELSVGNYSWRVKEGGFNSTAKWSASKAFIIPPATPDGIDPNTRYASAPATPTFEWLCGDSAANRFSIQLFKGADLLDTRLVSNEDAKYGGFITPWATPLGAGNYSWRVRSTRVLSGHNVSSPWSAPLAFQIGVPAPASITAPAAATRFAPGDQTIDFTWTAADGADSYKVKILLNGDLLRDEIVSGATTLSVGRNYTPGHYAVTVLPKNNDGSGVWSEPAPFEVLRKMKPGNAATLDQDPPQFVWTRSMAATRYLFKLSRYNPATRAYELLREKWIAQSAPAISPSWIPNLDLTPGAYKWVVTDFDGTSPLYTSATFFQLKVPGRMELLGPLGDVAGHRRLEFAWTDPTAEATEFQIEIWKGKTKVQDTGWAAASTFKGPSAFVKTFSFADDVSGNYTWQVQGRNAKGNGPWRVGAFHVSPLATPVVSAPLNNASLTIGDDVTIQWETITGATGYEITVQNSGTDPSVYTVSAPDTSAVWTPALTGAHTITVRATADGYSRPSTAVSVTVNPS